MTDNKPAEDRPVVGRFANGLGGRKVAFRDGRTRLIEQAVANILSEPATPSEVTKVTVAAFQSSI